MAVEYQRMAKPVQKERKVDTAMITKALHKLNESQSETVSAEYAEELSKPRNSTYMMNLGKLLMLSADENEIEQEIKQLEQEERLEPELKQLEQEVVPKTPEADAIIQLNQGPQQRKEPQQRPESQHGQEPQQQEQRKRKRRQHQLDLEAKLEAIRLEMQECIENMKREIPKEEKTEANQESQEKAQEEEPVGFMWPNDLTDMLLKKGYIKGRGKCIENVTEEKGTIEQAQGEKMAQAFEKAYELFDQQLTYESNNPLAKRMWLMEYHPDIICGIFSDGSTKTYVRGKDWN